MNVSTVELTLSLGKNQFITNWLSSPTSEGVVGTFVSNKGIETLRLEDDIISPYGNLEFDPDNSIVLLVPLSDLTIEITQFVPDLIRKVTAIPIANSIQKGNSDSEDYIVNHFDQNNNLVAESYSYVDEEAQLIKIVLVVWNNQIPIEVLKRMGQKRLEEL